MNKLFKSGWFAALIGMAAFSVTLGVLWKLRPPVAADVTAPGSTNVDATKPAKAAGTNAPPMAHGTNAAPAEDQVKAPPAETAKAETPAPDSAPKFTRKQLGEAGSLAFNNPEVADLVAKLHAKEARLNEQEKRIRDLKMQADLELQEIASITQAVHSAKALWEKETKEQFDFVSSGLTNKLAEMAATCTNMTPKKAEAWLKTFPADTIAKMMLYMDKKFAADVITEFESDDPESKSLAGEIGQRLLHTSLPKPQTGAKKPAAQ